MPPFVDMACGNPRLQPVFLNVYDVMQCDAVGVFNSMLARWWPPVNLGIFHAGVEIAGMNTETRLEVQRPHPGFGRRIPWQGLRCLRCNCCHFADDMVGRLGVQPLPDWIYRFARAQCVWRTFARPSSSTVAATRANHLCMARWQTCCPALRHRGGPEHRGGEPRRKPCASPSRTLCSSTSP